MKSIYSIICAICVICGFTACQDKDLPGSAAMQIACPDVNQIVGTPSGVNNYDYTLTWSPSSQGAVMQVAVFKNGSQIQALTSYPANTFTLKNLETNQNYEFLFKYATDEAVSKGVMTSYTRPGATAASELKMEQIDISEDEHNLQVTWKASPDATTYPFLAKSAARLYALEQPFRSEARAPMMATVFSAFSSSTLPIR